MCQRNDLGRFPIRLHRTSKRCLGLSVDSYFAPIPASVAQLACSPMDERSSQCEFVRNPEIVLAGNARKQYSGIQSCTNGLAQALMFFTTILQSRSPCFPVSLRFCVPVAWALLQYRLPPSRWVQPMQQTRRTVALKNPFLAENDQAMTG